MIKELINDYKHVFKEYPKYLIKYSIILVGIMILANLIIGKYFEETLMIDYFRRSRTTDLLYQLKVEVPVIIAVLVIIRKLKKEVKNHYEVNKITRSILLSYAIGLIIFSFVGTSEFTSNPFTYNIWGIEQEKLFNMSKGIIYFIFVILYPRIGKTTLVESTLEKSNIDINLTQIKKYKKHIFISLLVVITGVTLYVLSSSNIDNAIELVKNAQVPDSKNKKWKDLVNSNYSIEQGYSWKGKELENEEDKCLVEYTDEQGSGLFWLVNYKQEVVSYINGNDYLGRKYDIISTDMDAPFKIKYEEYPKIVTGQYTVSQSFWSIQRAKGFWVTFKAKLINNTDKVITSLEIDGSIKLLFPNKTISAELNSKSGYSGNTISKHNGWKPNEELTIFIETKGLEDTYLSYSPEFVYLEISVSAQDPIGFNYNRVIKDFDLKEQYTNLSKENAE